MLLKRKGQLRKSEIFFKEYLTQTNNVIYYLARKAKSYKVIEHVWIDNGKVWAIEKPNTDPIWLKDPSIPNSSINEAISAGVKPDRDWTDEPK